MIIDKEQWQSLQINLNSLRQSFNMIRIDIKSIFMVLIFVILPHKLSFSTAEKGKVG